MMRRAAWDAEEARSLIAARRDEPGAMLPILHDLLDRYGYIDDEAIPLIAAALNVSKAETLGVVSFYHDFRRRPVEGALMKLCRAESCQAAGCEDLVAHLRDRHGLGVDTHERGPITIETIYCLGHCAVSPTAILDGKHYARLTREKLDALVAQAKGSAQ
jgi:formate dehydrogenase subunit gamma